MVTAQLWLRISFLRTKATAVAHIRNAAKQFRPSTGLITVADLAAAAVVVAVGGAAAVPATTAQASLSAADSGSDQAAEESAAEAVRAVRSAAVLRPRTDSAGPVVPAHPAAVQAGLGAVVLPCQEQLPPELEVLRPRPDSRDYKLVAAVGYSPPADSPRLPA